MSVGDGKRGGEIRGETGGEREMSGETGGGRER